VELLTIQYSVTHSPF